MTLYTGKNKSGKKLRKASRDVSPAIAKKSSRRSSRDESPVKRSSRYDRDVSPVVKRSRYDNTYSTKRDYIYGITRCVESLHFLNHYPVID